MNFDMLPLTRLKPSPLNPRKHFDEQKLQELADSFGAVGIIEPLVVRPQNGHHEVIAGERRYRAAKLAHLDVVPVVVRDLTDDQVLEIMVIENGQRDDLDPLEEAAGYRALIATNPAKHTAGSIAERIGRSEKYVWDRMKLLDLIPEAVEHLTRGRMSAGHAILIARLKPEDQKRVINTDRGGLFEHQSGLDFTEDKALLVNTIGKGAGKKFETLKAVTVRELESWIANHVRFEVEHFAAAAPLDFGPTAARVEEATALPGRGKKVIPITHDYNSQSDAASSGEGRTYGSTSWRRADGTHQSKTCDHSVLGVVVAGREYGRSFEVCIARDKCEVHWKQEIAQKAKTAKLRASGQTAKAEAREKNSYQAQEERWKREREERERRQAAWEKVRGRALTRLGEALKKAGPTKTVIAALMERCRLHDAGDKKIFQQITGHVTARNVAVALLFFEIVDDLSREFGEFSKVAKVYGVDLKDLESEYKKLLTPQTSAVAKTTVKPAKGKKR